MFILIEVSENKFVTGFNTITLLFSITWWRLHAGGGSQKFGRETHLQICTNVSAGIHPRLRETAR